MVNLTFATLAFGGELLQCAVKFFDLKLVRIAQSMSPFMATTQGEQKVE